MEGIVDGKPVLFDEQPDDVNFEGWTALASWGEITSRVEIGLLVTGVGYRNPDLLADMARTVDHISGGRLILGLGAGWYEKDYTTYGYEYGTFKTRFDLFDESLLRIENRMAQLNPPPVRDIPVLIGGSGAKRSLPAVAKHADIWHAFLPVDKFVEASKLVDELAEANGREGSDIERSSVWENAADADAYRDAGVTLFTTEIVPDANGYDSGRRTDGEVARRLRPPRRRCRSSASPSPAPGRGASANRHAGRCGSTPRVGRREVSPPRGDRGPRSGSVGRGGVRRPAVPPRHRDAVDQEHGQADPDVRRDGPHLRVVGAPRGWGTVPAIVIGFGTALWGPAVARRLPWRAVPWVTWGVSGGWAFSLAMIDGWQRGFADRLATTNEYLRQVPSVTDIPYAVRSFSSRILDFQPNSWITHVSGHPPGALLTFVWLDRIGLGGGMWAAIFCVLIGTSAAAAIVVTARVLCGEELARAAAPFVAVAPTAIWIAVSADGYFAGVAAWGLALLALATRSAVRLPVLVAAAGGLLLGWGVFLNYGLGLIALLAVAVLVTAPDVRTALCTLVPAVVAALAVVGVFALAGFWWFDGYTLVQQRLAGHRGEPAVPVLGVGELRVGGLRGRTRHGGRRRARVRRPGDQGAVRSAPAGAGGAPGHSLRGSEHAQQGRGGADLVALHRLAHRGGSLPARQVAPLVAGRQRPRRTGAQPGDLHELVVRGTESQAADRLASTRLPTGMTEVTASPTSSARPLAQSTPTEAHWNHVPTVDADSSRTQRFCTPLIVGSNSATQRPPMRISSPARRSTRLGSPPRPTLPSARRTVPQRPIPGSRSNTSRRRAGAPLRRASSTAV